MKGWKLSVLDEIAYINPTERLAKGEPAKKVAMELLQPFSKRVTGFSVEPYNGGMKFRNGDTIVARITPCLENGKTAYIDILGNDEVGFGSTEYIVLREKKEISDKQFIYYFSISDEFRDVAILAMTGSSGRQRVEIDVVRNHTFLLPPLSEQKAIAAVLSSLDDKIDLLHRQNKTLEAMAETLFRQWFVEEADEGWEEGKILDYCLHHKDGVKPQNQPNEIFSHYSIPAFDNSLNPVIECGSEIQSNKYSVVQNSFLFSKLNPNKVKRIWLILDDLNENAICSTEFQVVRPKDKKYLFFTYLWLSIPQNYDEIASGVGGTSGSHQRIDPADIFNFACPLIGDDLLISLNSKVAPIFMKVMENRVQIRTLEKLRDTLLPKLMSGEIRVKI